MGIASSKIRIPHRTFLSIGLSYRQWPTCQAHTRDVQSFPPGRAEDDSFHVISLKRDCFCSKGTFGTVEHYLIDLEIAEWAFFPSSYILQSICFCAQHDKTAHRAMGEENNQFYSPVGKFVPAGPAARSRKMSKRTTKQAKHHANTSTGKPAGS